MKTAMVCCVVSVVLLAQSGQAGEDLLDAQLSQARSIAASDKSQADDQVAVLKAEIAAMGAKWSERLTQPAAANELLKGLPEDLLAQVQAIGGDVEKTTAQLKNGVSLEFLLALTAVRNPEVRAAYQNWQAATKRFDQAAYLEDLVGQYRAFVRELDTKVGPQKHKEMPGKTFPFPSSLTLKGEIVDATVEIAWLKYQSTLRQSLDQTARAFFDVQYASRALAILSQIRTLFEQMVGNTKTRVEAGTVGQADALKAQSEWAIIDNRIAILQRERINTMAHINTSLNLPAESAWGEVKEDDLVAQLPGLDEALRQGRASNQELLSARRNLTLMQLMVRMAETEILPRASVGYSQLALSMGAEAGPTRSKMAAFPGRPNVTPARAGFGANAAFLDELRMRAEQAAEMAAMAERKTEFAIKDALFRLDSAKRNQTTYGEQVVPRIKQAFDTLKARYDSGGAPFIEFLDAGRSYLQNTLMFEAAQRDQNKAAVDLQDALGESAVQRLKSAPEKVR